jgi:hypothetical protein
MSLLNLNVSLLAYSDGPKSAQPKLRLADLSWSLLGIPTDNFKNIPISLAPGETMTVATTARTLSYSPSTSFAVTSPSAGRMRISASIGQRTARSYGDSTTTFALTRAGNAMTLTSTGGTAPDFTTFHAGDFLYFGSAYSPFNQGEFQIVKVGSGLVEFVNPIGIAEGPIAASLNAYSTGPVQAGDILDISDPAFAILNQGQFPVVLATDSFIDVLNVSAFPETATGLANGLQIYPFAYKWLAIAIDRKILVGLNGDAPSTIEVEPPAEGDLVNSPGFMIKRGKVYEVQVTNATAQQAQGFLILAE